MPENPPRQRRLARNELQPHLVGRLGCVQNVHGDTCVFQRLEGRLALLMERLEPLPGRLQVVVRSPLTAVQDPLHHYVVGHV